MNSFRFLERGIEAELDRQVGVVESGEEVAQETFHFDPRTGSLTPLRSKEYAHDYRYFPEPDLVPLAPTEEMLSAARDALPELPAKRRERYRDELGLPDESARQLAFDADLGEYFENALDAADGLEPRIVANWVTGELAAAQRHFGHKKDVEPAHAAEVVRMVADKRISHASGREVLHTLSDPGRQLLARRRLSKVASWRWSRTRAHSRRSLRRRSRPSPRRPRRFAPATPRRSVRSSAP